MARSSNYWTSVPPPCAHGWSRLKHTAICHDGVRGQFRQSRPVLHWCSQCPNISLGPGCDRSLARLLRKLSSKPAFTAKANPGRNRCRERCSLQYRRRAAVPCGPVGGGGVPQGPKNALLCFKPARGQFAGDSPAALLGCPACDGPWLRFSSGPCCRRW